ncbi:MAG TPA: pyridoxal phosphate-dependent aminotransferase [Candidatus Scatomorpha merdavium]|nr:pyridoxal phosphate-dependent aminotransferase [Candidatus Scatomorpha merdavium]
MKLSSKIQKCELSPIRKFAPFADAARARGIKIYPLNIGQPDIETPAAFFDAVRNFESPVLEYAPSAGIPAYLKAVHDYYTRIGIELEPGDMLATAGGSEALSMTLACILDDGDELLTAEPFYPNYSTFTQVTGATIRPIPTFAEEGFRYAVRERIEPLINEHTRAILMTNPGNPTGYVLSRAEMRVIADIAKEHDLYVVSDEVYREFVYGGEEMTSMLEFEDLHDNVIVVDSVSKRFSACGARVGVVVSRNKAFMTEAMKICQGRLCVATLDQVGAAALYSVGPEYFAAVREEYKRRRDTALKKLLAIPGVVCEQPEGAFYLMAKLPVDSTDKFQQWLLVEFNADGDTVMLTPGEGFYATPGKGVNEARLAYVLKQADLERAMDVLALGIAAYNAR